MIVLITASERACECVKLLSSELKEKSLCCRTLNEARRLVHTNEKSVVVLDQLLAESEVEELDRLAAELTSPLVMVNLAISAPKRVVAQVRIAMRRAEHEREAMQRTVVSELRGELSSTVTGILLASQLALNEPGLSETAQEKVRAIYRLAKDLRAHLRA